MAKWNYAINTCKCGGTYILEKYHFAERSPEHRKLCHSCYRKERKEHQRDNLAIFDYVSFKVKRLGIDGLLQTAWAVPGTHGMITGYEPEKKAYRVLCGGGYYFLVRADQIQRIHRSQFKQTVLEPIDHVQEIINMAQKMVAEAR